MAEGLVSIDGRPLFTPAPERPPEIGRRTRKGIVLMHARPIRLPNGTLLPPCQRPALLFVGPEVGQPLKGERVRASHFRHLDGHPVGEDEQVDCDTCGKAIDTTRIPANALEHIEVWI